MAPNSRFWLSLIELSGVWLAGQNTNSAGSSPTRCQQPKTS